MKNVKGITLIALILTIIVLLILAGIAVNSLMGKDGIINNAVSSVDRANIASDKERIHLAVMELMIEKKQLTVDNIIDKLIEKEITTEGDANRDTSQVKTDKGYIFDISVNEKGGYEVEYVGKGEVAETELKINITKDVGVLTTKVTLTITAKADSGIATYTNHDGETKTYTNNEKTISETYDVTANGTYNFTVKNKKGTTYTESIEITNILEGTVTIKPSTNLPTNKNITVEVTWPSDTTGFEKKISKDDGVTWEDYTGPITIEENCVVKARLLDSAGEIARTATCDIQNIDKTDPTVTAKEATVTITEEDEHDLGEYFTVVANGKYGIASTKYLDTSNGNVEVSNTNTLEVGTHVIKCTVTKETGASANASVTIEVKQFVSPPEEPSEPTEGTNVIVIENIKITTDEAGTTVPAENSLSLNTPVYITFDAKIDGGKINTITPSLPYQTNGTEMNVKFTVTGEKDGKTITEEKRVIFTDKYTEEAKISNVSGKNPLQYALHYRVTEGEMADKFNVWGNTTVEEGKTCKCEQAKMIFDKAKEERRVAVFDNIDSSGRYIYANITEPSLVYYEYKCLNSEQKPGGRFPAPYSLNYECNFNYCGWKDFDKPTFNKVSADIEDALVWLDDECAELGCTFFCVRPAMFPSETVESYGQKYHWSIQVLTKTDFLKTAKEMGIDVSDYNCLIEL